MLTVNTKFAVDMTQMSVRNKVSTPMIDL